VLYSYTGLRTGKAESPNINTGLTLAAKWFTLCFPFFQYLFFFTANLPILFYFRFAAANLRCCKGTMGVGRIIRGISTGMGFKDCWFGYVTDGEGVAGLRLTFVNTGFCRRGR
jgi:hypothetical protein